jgi:hypothetical protein
VATHLRSLRPYRATIVVEHMPSYHRRYRELLASVCGWFTGGFSTQDLLEAKSILAEPG